jgi:hypothetical protein
VVLFCLAAGTAQAGQTITAVETESYFYADGDMKPSKGQFEITYFLEGDKVTRTRVYDVIKKEVIPDDTVYLIMRHLASDPTMNKSGVLPSVIRAVGQPGTDAVELLVIGETFIQSTKSTSDYFVISRLKRIK